MTKVMPDLKYWIAVFVLPVVPILAVWYVSGVPFQRGEALGWAAAFYFCAFPISLIVVDVVRDKIETPNEQDAFTDT